MCNKGKCDNHKSEIKEIKNEVIEDNVEYYGEVYKVEELTHEIKDEDIIEDDLMYQPGTFRVLFIKRGNVIDN